MAASTKAEADALFRKAKYGEAATKYGLAIKQDPENEKLYAYLAATRGPAEEPPFPRFERMPCVVRAREHGGRE